MPSYLGGIVPRYQEGPVTFPVGTAVTAGMLVETNGASPAALQPASAGSKLVIGVATLDAVPAATSQTPTVPGWSGPSINVSPLPPYTSVATEGVWQLTFAANASFGARLKAAAGGQVTPWVDGTDDPAMVVGVCYETAGVTFVSGGSPGAVRLAGFAGS